MKMRIARTLLGLTCCELARVAGIDHPALSRYERGQLNPTGPRGRAVCAALGIDPEWVFADWRAVK